MKLYTEEQVEKILCTAIYIENPQIQSDKVHIEANKYLKQLTPIELPSDEDIDNAVTEYTWKLGFSVKSYVGDVYKDGAKYVRDKILNK